MGHTNPYMQHGMFKRTRMKSTVPKPHPACILQVAILIESSTCKSLEMKFLRFILQNLNVQKFCMWAKKQRLSLFTLED